MDLEKMREGFETLKHWREWVVVANYGLALISEVERLKGFVVYVKDMTGWKQQAHINESYKKIEQALKELEAPNDPH